MNKKAVIFIGLLVAVGWFIWTNRNKRSSVKIQDKVSPVVGLGGDPEEKPVTDEALAVALYGTFCNRMWQTIEGYIRNNSKSAAYQNSIWVDPKTGRAFLDPLLMPAGFVDCRDLYAWLKLRNLTDGMIDPGEYITDPGNFGLGR